MRQKNIYATLCGLAHRTEVVTVWRPGRCDLTITGGLGDGGWTTPVFFTCVTKELVHHQYPAALAVFRASDVEYVRSKFGDSGWLIKLKEGR